MQHFEKRCAGLLQLTCGCKAECYKLFKHDIKTRPQMIIQSSIDTFSKDVGKRAGERLLIIKTLMPLSQYRLQFLVVLFFIIDYGLVLLTIGFLCNNRVL